MVSLFFLTILVIYIIYDWDKSTDAALQESRRMEKRLKEIEKEKHDVNDILEELTKRNERMYMSAEEKAKYLKSPKWILQKLTRELISGEGCEACGKNTKLELHHITYERLGDEHIEDLALVCRECHQGIHDRLGRDRQTRYPIKE